MSTIPSITFLGTCAGTEPMLGRHHTSIVIHNNDKDYWFDAGESCSYTAHTMGLNIPDIEALFISHTHMDHVGGIPNLLWTMEKLCLMYKDAFDNLNGRTVDLFIPEVAVWQTIKKFLEFTENGFKVPFKINARRYEKGIIYNKNNVKVIALNNLHLGEIDPNMSFSFRIELENKNIVYSGDVAKIEELVPILNNCDILLMETGHHKVEDICNWIKTSNIKIKQLIFIHSGRAVIKDSKKELEKAQEILGDMVLIAEDGMKVEI